MEWTASISERLIDSLAARFRDASIKSLRRSLDVNACRVNGRVERFASKKVSPGDRISFSLVSNSPKKVLSFPILFEDEWIKIIDKPPGWVCEDQALRRLFGPQHWLIHRLDKDTSGLLLIAKTAQVKEKFISLFTEKGVTKWYVALVDGICKKHSLVKESWFVKQKTFAGQTIWGSLPSTAMPNRGLYACTHVETIALGKQASLLACQPITGRTHQIRVHLAELGHPILVDRQYAANFRCVERFLRTMLHAFCLRFIHPITKERLECFAPLPRDMWSSIDLVGISSSVVSQFLMEQTQIQSGDEGNEDKQSEKII